MTSEGPKWEVPEPTNEQYARCLMFHSKEEAEAFVAELRELRKLPQVVLRCVEALNGIRSKTGEAAHAEIRLAECVAATKLREAATEEGKTRGLRKDA